MTVSIRSLKMKKWLFAAVGGVSIMLAGNVWAGGEPDEMEATVGGTTWYYQIERGAALICGAKEVGVSLSIPEELDGNPVMSIEDWAFEDCEKLETVTIPSRLLNVCGNAFSGCSKLKSFIIDPGNTNYKFEDGLLMSANGKELVRASAAISSLIVPESVTCIGECAFNGLTELSSIAIGRNVEDIEDFAFGGCRALTTITVDPANRKYKVKNGLLLGDERDGKYLVRASADCTALETPKGVTVIGSDAVSDIETLESVTISDDVREIAESAFNGSSRLSMLVIGAGVKEIGESAFAGCSALAKIVFNGNIPSYEPADDDDTIFADVPSSCVVFVQKGSDWGDEFKIPGKWQGMTLNYIGTDGDDDAKGDGDDTKGNEDVKEEIKDRSFTVGVGTGVNGLSLQLPAGTKNVTIKGLPPGMKFDKKSETIIGAPTKVGNYTVTISAIQANGTKSNQTVTFTVDEINSAAVGTFKGFVYTDDDQKAGTIQLTADEKGKLSAKVVTVAGQYSFSATSWTAVDEDGAYRVEFSTTKGDTLSLKIGLNAKLNEASLFGTFVAKDKKSLDVSASTCFLAQTWYFTADGSANSGWTLKRTSNAKAADLTLATKGDGSTLIKGKLGSYSVNAKGFVDFCAITQGVIAMEFAPVVSVREGNRNVSRVIDISTILNFAAEGDAFSGTARIVTGE